MQKNRSILLGITGGIAAYKVADLVRLLVAENYDVQIVMTEAATRFITPLTMQAISGKPIFINMWDSSIANGMPHIELSRQADVILIAPASADFIAKLVHGNTDDLLSTLCLARNCPLLVAPAMNKKMWENKATQRNIAQCLTDGIGILGPGNGEQACGEIGDGRMLEADQLLGRINAHFTPKHLTGKKILITAGATLEMIDPVRGITNISSGKMGFAIAQVANNMGADVTLIAGNTTLLPPNGIKTISTSSSEDMYDAVMQHVSEQDIFMSVAAVADYSPIQKQMKKIKKSENALTLKLQRNKDILAEVAHLPNAPFCVGFAAETEDLIKYADEKRQSKKLPLLVANLVQESMGQDSANITLIDDSGTHPLPRASKTELATILLTHLSKMLN